MRKFKLLILSLLLLIVTVGCDLITAYYRMETLELFAKISLTAHLLGGAKEIEKPQIDKLLD